MRKFKLLGALVCAVFLLSLAGPTPKATAVMIGFPNYFPPYANTGTVVEIGAIDGPETCIVFLDDSGTLYYFTGVDSFAAGTRLKVTGNLCTICLSTLTCDMPVSPILNAVATEI